MVGNRKKISKYMTYLLRHEPSGLDVSNEGFVEMSSLLEKLRDRWPDITKSHVREVVERDPKGRYEIKEGKIRARYGHSIDVQPTLNEATADVLYHGTTSQAAQNILEEGLKSRGRQKVHLSATVEDAMEVGKRRTRNPVILRVNVEKAQSEGINVERASDKVFVADYIPPRFISIGYGTD